MEGVCLRYFNIFGPRQAADSPYSGVIAQFIYKMMAGETPTINGDGIDQPRLHLCANAVNANLLACLAPKEVATGRVFNVGTGHSHTLNELYDALAEILGFSAKPNYGPPGRATSSTRSPASTRAVGSSGYKPTGRFPSRAWKRPSPGTCRKERNTS